MCIKLLLLVLISLSVCCLSVKGQQTLDGQVLDQVSNKRLDQIHVINITKNVETISNGNGEFSVVADLGDLLVYRSIGYRTDTVLVTRLKSIKHYLKISVNNLASVKINTTVNYKEQYATAFNKANAVLLTPGRGLLFYPSSYFSREGKQLRRFKRMVKKEQKELLIDRYFNQRYISTILPIKGEELSAFIVLYRPSLAFIKRASADDLKFYLMDAYQKFKILPAEKRALPSLKLNENY